MAKTVATVRKVSNALFGNVDASGGVVPGAADIQPVIDAYNAKNAESELRRRIALAGRQIAFAEPSSTDGTPSMINSHCQPLSPITPSSPSSRPETGAPIKQFSPVTVKPASVAQQAAVSSVPPKQEEPIETETLPATLIADITGRDSDGELIAKPAEWDEAEQSEPPRIRIYTPRHARPGATAGVGDRALLRVERVGDGGRTKDI